VAVSEIKVFNTRKVGGPTIILYIPNAGDAVIPAEGSDGKGGLIEGAKGITVFVDKAWLERQYGHVSGLKVGKEEA